MPIESGKHLIFHVGTHKTGTTSIQTMMGAHREFFETQGVLFPYAGHVRNGGHHNIAWELNGDAGYDPQLGTLADLATELAATTLSSVILSSEDFEFWHLRPDLLAQIKHVAEGAGFSVEVLLVLRPVTEYVESLYKELLKHGLSVSRRTFVETIATTGAYPFRERTYRFDYAEMVQGFQAAFGAEHVYVLEYEVGDSNTPFFAACGKIFGTSVHHLAVWGRQNPRRPPLRYRLKHPLKGHRRGTLTKSEAALLHKRFTTPISDLVRTPA
ncbi:MAG: hypothetical protein WCG62_06870 [Actinomycetes bacterium]